MSKTFSTVLLSAFMIATPVHAQNLFKTLTDIAATVGEKPTAVKVANLLTAGDDFETYGNWQFKVDDVLIGADGEWQAVISARNAQEYRQGMVASEIKAALITADGESLQNWGELYRASVSGGGAGLEKLPGTLWIEPGQTARFRLRFADSRRIQPVRIRLESTGATAQSRSFDLN